MDLVDSDLRSDGNPYAAPEELNEVNRAYGATSLANAIDAIASAATWLRRGLILSAVTVVAWFGLIANLINSDWQQNLLGPEDVYISVGSLPLLSLAWPGFWLLKTTSRIHRAIEEQTLSSIADVLEAQRSFWQSLGVLVLLAIAAIVVAATYPSWGL